MNKYPAIFTKENDIYGIHFPDLSGCFSMGESFEEAIKMASEALYLYLEELKNSKTKIPQPSNPYEIEINKENQTICIITPHFDERKYLKDKREVVRV